MIALAVHEYGHLIAHRLLGSEGSISSNALNVVKWMNVSADPTHRFLVGVSGGLAVVLVLGFLYLFDVDRENKFAYLLWAGNNLIYCFFEGYSTMVLDPTYMKWGSNIATVYMATLILHYLFTGRFSLDNLPDK